MGPPTAYVCMYAVQKGMLWVLASLVVGFVVVAVASLGGSLPA